MLHFAYGSNMHRGARCATLCAVAAEPIGVARLGDYRFVITADGYASVEPARAQAVHGVMWRLTPRDRVTLDLWENIASGLYRAEMLPVQQAGCLHPALVYIARRRPSPAEAGLYGGRARGRPRAGTAGGVSRFFAGMAAGAVAGRRLLPRSLEHSVESASSCRHPRPRSGRRLPCLDRSDRARRSGVEGWVRNRRDGTVEALFVGLDDAVTAMSRGLPQRPVSLARRRRGSP